MRIHLRWGRELIFFAIDSPAVGELRTEVSVLNCFAGIGMVSNKEDILPRDFFCAWFNFEMVGGPTKRRGCCAPSPKPSGAGFGDLEPARKMDATQGI